MGLDESIQKLLKQPVPRSIEDADTLQSYFSNLTFFSKLMDSFGGEEYKEFIVSSIWRTIRYQSFKVNQVVFKEKDASNGKMFVIISGEACVAIKKKINVFEEENKKLESLELQSRQKTEESRDQKESDSDENDSSDPYSKEDRMNDNQGNMGRTHRNMSLLPQTSPKGPLKIAQTFTPRNLKKALGEDNNNSSANFSKGFASTVRRIQKSMKSIKFDPATLGDVIARLGSGLSFGEKAIMEEGGIRMASIYASSDMETLVIMKEDFLSIKKKIDETKRDKITMIKQTIPGLEQVNSWSILEQLAYVFSEQKFLKNDILTDQGSKSTTIFLLVSGTIEICSSIEMEIESSKNPEIEKIKQLQSGGHPEKKTKKTKTRNQKGIENQTESDQRLTKEKIEMKICEIDCPQFVCEDVLAFRTQQYTVRVVSSRAVCYVISKRNFQLKFPRESVELTKQMFISKHKRRQEAITNQLWKYQQTFREEDKQESLNKVNRDLKQKFKRQYFQKIYSQSLLKQSAQANANIEEQEKHSIPIDYDVDATRSNHSSSPKYQSGKLPYLSKKPLTSFSDSIMENQPLNQPPAFDASPDNNNNKQRSQIINIDLKFISRDVSSPISTPINNKREKQSSNSYQNQQSPITRKALFNFLKNFQSEKVNFSSAASAQNARFFENNLSPSNNKNKNAIDISSNQRGFNSERTSSSLIPILPSITEQERNHSSSQIIITKNLSQFQHLRKQTDNHIRPTHSSSIQLRNQSEQLNSVDSDPGLLLSSHQQQDISMSVHSKCPSDKRSIQQQQQQQHLMLPQTWNMGNIDLKKQESELKQHLQNIGLMKSEDFTQQITKNFPGLWNFKRDKIINRIKRHKQKQLGSSESANIQNYSAIISSSSQQCEDNDEKAPCELPNQYNLLSSALHEPNLKQSSLERNVRRINKSQLNKCPTSHSFIPLNIRHQSQQQENQLSNPNESGQKVPKILESKFNKRKASDSLCDSTSHTVGITIDQLESQVRRNSSIFKDIEAKASKLNKLQSKLAISHRPQQELSTALLNSQNFEQNLSAEGGGSCESEAKDAQCQTTYNNNSNNNNNNINNINIHSINRSARSVDLKQIAATAVVVGTGTTAIMSQFQQGAIIMDRIKAMRPGIFHSVFSQNSSGVK